MDQENFRKEAEKIIEKLQQTDHSQVPDPERAMHDLHVYQMELELRNNQLKKSSEELFRSNRRFTDLFEFAPVGYLLLDENFRIINSNHSACNLLTHDKSILSGKTFSGFVHPDHQDNFHFLMQKVMQSDQLQTLEIKLTTDQKKELYVQLQCIRETEEHSSTRIRLVMMDITERIVIGKKFKRFRAALDSAVDNIILIDYETLQLIDANDSALKNLDVTVDELAGMMPNELNPDFNEEKLKAFRNIYLKETGKEHITEFRIHKKQGDPIDLEVFLKTVQVDEEKIIVLVAHNITERKKNQVKLANYAREMEELNASKDRFLSIISHDLRGPFIGLKGYTQMLLEEHDLLDHDEVMDYLNKIHDASKDLYTLVENLLKWSRLELGKIPYEPVSFNLADELEPLLKLLGGMASKKDIALEINIPEDLFPLADKLMLISVMQNLVGNAIKFTRKNGIIKVDARAEEDKILIFVEDNGVGMTAEIKQRLFTLDKGHTSRGTAGEKGTGFGLIITKEMIRKMGGELYFNSEPEKGSTFSFTLQNSVFSS
jgi:two-component system, sensor histidine kinase and response regulator